LAQILTNFWQSLNEILYWLHPLILERLSRVASTGADAFKALALGAHAVLLGRPYLWGLALGGEQGVQEVVLNFLVELDLTLALSGYNSLQSLDRSALVREA
jgi:isopentenyl diphosphate isomerase/L-lactate dehydrogenase-like FMN-dependent dehydrogenase